MKFLNLKESTIRNFKKSYKERLDYQLKQLHPQPVTKIMAQPRGRPPILQELDTKLIKFLRALRSRGSVINIHVVRAATQKAIHQQSNSVGSICHVLGFSPFTDAWDTPEEWGPPLVHQWHRDFLMNAG